MSLGSRRALLACAGGGKGLGDEQSYMLYKVDVSGNTTALVSFTSSGSDDSWANYKHLVFIAAISTHVYSDNKVNIYVNNYNHRTTTSYRPYYNLRLSNMVSGSSHNMEYSNLNSGTGDQYASQGPCMGNGYSGWADTGKGQALNVVTFWDINRANYTKFYTYDCFPFKPTGGTSQDWHGKTGVHAFHGPGYGSTAAITQVDFGMIERANFSLSNCSCYGIKGG